MAKMVITKKQRSIYLTARDPKTKRSKTVTLRGEHLTPDRLIRLVLRALDKNHRKAG